MGLPPAAAPGSQRLYTTAAEYRFSAESNGAACLGTGWGPIEAGFVWSIGPEATLTVPVAPEGHDLMLQLLGTPHTAPPRYRRQRVAIAVNGHDLGEDDLRAEFALGIPLPAATFGTATTLDIRLRFPDAIAPRDAQLSADTRPLGIALAELLVLRVPPAPPPTPPRVLPPLPVASGDFGPRTQEIVRGFTALGLPELALQFESLGVNCEFGAVQRRFGAEPLGLLRFTGIRLHALLRGLDLGFPGAEDPALMHLYADDTTNDEYLLHNTRWGMDTHTHRMRGEITEEALLREQSRKIAYYRRKLFAELETGEKICVFQRRDKMGERQMLPLLATLRSFGPNALLVVNKDLTQPPGTVRRLQPGLYHGAIDWLAPPEQPEAVNHTAWISLTANAYRLWREDGGGT